MTDLPAWLPRWIVIPLAMVVGLTAIGFGTFFSLLLTLALAAQSTEIKAGEWLQAIAAFMGSIVGVIGAYGVASWSMFRSERERRVERSYAASALINTASGRYDDMTRIVQQLAAPEGKDTVAHFVAIPYHLIYVHAREDSSALMEEFARHFVYEVRELNELDSKLQMTQASFADALRHHAESRPDMVGNDVARGVAHLSVAAAAWLNIVNAYADARRAAMRDDGSGAEYVSDAKKLLGDIESIAKNLPKIENS